MVTFLTFYLVVMGFTALVCLLLMLDADRRDREAQLKPVARSVPAYIQHTLSAIFASIVLGTLWPTMPLVLIWSNVRRANARIRAAEAHIQARERGRDVP